MSAASLSMPDKVKFSKTARRIVRVIERPPIALVSRLAVSKRCA
jgi:hypothetical protein